MAPNGRLLQAWHLPCLSGSIGSQSGCAAIAVYDLVAQPHGHPKLCLANASLASRETSFLKWLKLEHELQIPV